MDGRKNDRIKIFPTSKEKVRYMNWCAKNIPRSWLRSSENR